MSAREAMLASIREALGPAPEVPEVTRAYARAREGDTVALFCERASDYRATVTRVGRGEEDAAVAAALEARGSQVVARPGDHERPLTEVDAAVTGCALAIAETGTIVLDGGPESGRRALTLVPDHHICVVRADRIVMTVPEAIAALADAARSGRPITLISGPSATSDIELERVEGVHGPRKLDVLVVEE